MRLSLSSSEIDQNRRMTKFVWMLFALGMLRHEHYIALHDYAHVIQAIFGTTLCRCFQTAVQETRNGSHPYCPSL